MFSRPFRKKGTLNATTFLRTFRVSAGAEGRVDDWWRDIRGGIGVGDVPVFFSLRKRKQKPKALKESAKREVIAPRRRRRRLQGRGGRLEAELGGSLVVSGSARAGGNLQRVDVVREIAAGLSLSVPLNLKQAERVFFFPSLREPKGGGGAEITLSRPPPIVCYRAEHPRPSLPLTQVGDYVDIKVNAAQQKGMPYLAYQGRTGIVWNVTPRAVGVEVNKQVRASWREPIEDTLTSRGATARGDWGEGSRRE
jgi:ribosomal protein L21E